MTPKIIFMITGSIFNTVLLGMIGTQEIILIVIAILILFGGRKIPEFMRGIGKGIREFNDAKNNVKKEIEEGMNEKEKQASSSSSSSTQ